VAVIIIIIMEFAKLIVQLDNIKTMELIIAIIFVLLVIKVVVAVMVLLI